jgi:thiol-disulfide isomerase/thioredoxin
MKRSFAVLLFSLIFNIAFAQTTIISGKVPSMKKGKITINRPSKWLIDSDINGVSLKKQIAQNGSFTLDLKAIDKEIILFTVWDSLQTKKLYEQYLYISKGDKITLNEKSDGKVVITDAGTNHSKLVGVSIFYDVGEAYGDPLPDRVYERINSFCLNDKILIDNYLTQYKPSKEVVDAWNYHLKYARLAAFYSIFTNNPVRRNNPNWTAVFNQLKDEVATSEDKALVSPSYQNYLGQFLFANHEGLREDFDKKPVKFYNEWFGGDSLKAKAVMEIDPKNQLKQKIIERYFTGKVKEQMYGRVFYYLIHEQNFFNAKSVFNDFERQYPNSQYIKYFKKPIQEAVVRLENTIPKKAIFLEGNTTAKWDNILEYFKGKTVFLDMWGTWCSPCREEIEKNAAALKKHFEGKGVEFLYVTNYDKNETKCKQLIAFYNLEGCHVFANEALTDEIMEKIKGTGFPSYAIIDKNGKIAKVEYPIDRKELIQQIEVTLKK